MNIKLANNSTMSFRDLEKAHYQLFELLVYFLTEYPGKLAEIRNAIVNNDTKSIPKNTIDFMRQKQLIDKNYNINQSVQNICESYIASDGSFNKTFIKNQK